MTGDDLPDFEMSFYEQWAVRNGLDYVCFEEGLHLFERKVVKPERDVPGKPGYRYVREVLYEPFYFSDTDIQDQSAVHWLERGYSRIPGFRYE